LVGQGEGRTFVLILVARECHSRRLRRQMIPRSNRSSETSGSLRDRLTEV
jgi:hypothetical protein